MMNTIAMIIGYVVLVIAGFVGIVYGLEWTTDRHEGVVSFKIRNFYGFGYLWVPLTNNTLLSNLRKVRKDKNAGFTFKSGVLFILTPEWFNRYVYNAGTR